MEFTHERNNQSLPACNIKSRFSYAFVIQVFCKKITLLCIIPLMEDLKLISLDFSTLSQEVIEILLLDSTAEPSLFDEIVQKNTHRPEILRYILNHSNTPETTKQLVAQILHTSIRVTKQEETREGKAQTLLKRIQRMNVGEKIQLALRGSREIRSILLRDSSKEVVAAVLENPKITESEIEILAKQKTSPEEVLRIIAKNREWMKNYSIMHAIVTNPKTPVGIALSYINAIRLKELILIEKNKFVSEAIRAAAKKLVAERKPS